MRPTVRPLLLALLLLSACAPRAERVAVTQQTAPATFYPHQTGAVWRYLAEGDAPDAPPVTVRAEGPTVVDGQRLNAWRTVGRGLSGVTYRDHREDGVFTVLESGPGFVTTLSPPIREWPAPAELKLGATWGGAARAVVTFTEARETRRFDLSYRYEVVDQRTVTVPAGTFEVFVVALESRSLGARGEVLETLRGETWFTPFVGVVRTEGDLVLVETSARPPEARPR